MDKRICIRTIVIVEEVQNSAMNTESDHSLHSFDNLFISVTGVLDKYFEQGNWFLHAIENSFEDDYQFFLDLHIKKPTYRLSQGYIHSCLENQLDLRLNATNFLTKPLMELNKTKERKNDFFNKFNTTDYDTK